jgi:hypothetical protein
MFCGDDSMLCVPVKFEPARTAFVFIIVAKAKAVGNVYEHLATCQ